MRSLRPVGYTATLCVAACGDATNAFLPGPVQDDASTTIPIEDAGPHDSGVLVEECRVGSCGPRQTCTVVNSATYCTCNVDPACPFGAHTTCDGDSERTCVADEHGCAFLASERSCSAVEQTCFNNACNGECAAGTFRCNDAGNQETCNAAGVWGDQVVCNIPTDICDVSTGKCIYSGLPNLGVNTPSNLTLKLSDNDLLAVRIVTAQAVEVANLGLTATSASVGGAAVLALYTDILDETGHHPGTRFAYTMSFGIAAGSDNLNGVQSGTRLAANTVYWVVAKISELKDEDIEIYRYDPSDLGGFNSRYAVSTTGWSGGNPPPDTFAEGPTFFAGRVSLFASVRQYAE